MCQKRKWLPHKDDKSDREKGYTSKEFNKYYEDEGLEHQLIVGYAPEQNDISERNNRAMMEIARSILIGKGVEAVRIMVYLLNRCPTKTMEGKTHIEAWSGRNL